MRYRIDIMARESCYSGFLHLARYRLRHSLFRGGWSEPLVRERLEGLRAAACLLYDPLLDRVVLIEQFRIGALEQGPAAWTLETVGGVIVDGEDPAEVVRREAMEEAGCEITALEPIGSLQVSPGISDERVWLYCGCVDSSSAGGIHGLREEGEDIRALVLDADQSFLELFSGRIANTTAIICTQWLAINRDRLKLAWAGA